MTMLGYDSVIFRTKNPLLPLASYGYILPSSWTIFLKRPGIPFCHPSSCLPSLDLYQVYLPELHHLYPVNGWQV